MGKQKERAPKRTDAQRIVDYQKKIARIQKRQEIAKLRDEYNKMK